MRTKPLLLVPVTLSLLACKGSSEQPPPASGSATAVLKEPAPPARAEDLDEKMRHCPVTLEGVTAELADVDGGVQFMLQASTPEVVAEARRRAHALVDFTAGRAKTTHGGGKGGGFMRNCPIITKDAMVVAEDTDGGVRITVKPTDSAKLAEFRATARERFERAPLERAKVVREESSDDGETRLFSGSVADLDGDGTLELVAGGYSSQQDGRHPTILVYRQNGDAWAPVAEAGWDTEPGSMVRNIEIADIDSDGKLDVIALGRVGKSPHDASARLTVFALVGGKLVQQGDQLWKNGQYSHGYGLAVGDLDRDGKLEIVTAGFERDGDIESGFVRVWKREKDAIAPHGTITLDGQGSPSMRVNDIAIGDVDGDGKPEIVVAGRHGPLKTAASKDLAKRRESGDLSVLSFAKDKLAVRARHTWGKGTSARFRSVALVDLNSDRKLDMVVGGQYDADGKAALATFAFDKTKLVLKQDASSTAEGVTGEVKDLVVAPHDGKIHVLVTGSIGEKPSRHGIVAAWRVDKGTLVNDENVVSRNGDETRARSVIVMPGKDGSKILTVGYAKNSAAMVGQVLEWKLAASAISSRQP
jgi:hypothetical protein